MSRAGSLDHGEEDQEETSPESRSDVNGESGTDKKDGGGEDVEVGDEGEDEEDYSSSTSPSPEPVASTLNAAGWAAPTAEVRSILANLCERNGAAKKYLDSQLLVPIRNDVAGRKRKIFETCINFNKEFRVIDNEARDCIYHPGNYIPNLRLSCTLYRRRADLRGCIGQKEENPEASIWDDHEVDKYGFPEDDINDADYEEGFQWTCCEEMSAEEGCVESKHKVAAVAPQAKRVRYGYDARLVR